MATSLSKSTLAPAIDQATNPPTSGPAHPAEDWVRQAARDYIDWIDNRERVMDEGGLRFINEAIFHLIDKANLTRENLKIRLPYYLPYHKPVFLRTLLDRLIGSNPDTHPIYERSDRVLACHRSAT